MPFTNAQKAGWSDYKISRKSFFNSIIYARISQCVSSIISAVYNCKDAQCELSANQLQHMLHSSNGMMQGRSTQRTLRSQI